MSPGTLVPSSGRGHPASNAFPFKEAPQDARPRICAPSHRPSSSPPFRCRAVAPRHSSSKQVPSSRHSRPSVHLAWAVPVPLAPPRSLDTLAARPRHGTGTWGREEEGGGNPSPRSTLHTTANRAETRRDEHVRAATQPQSPVLQSRVEGKERECKKKFVTETLPDIALPPFSRLWASRGPNHRCPLPIPTFKSSLITAQVPTRLALDTHHPSPLLPPVPLLVEGTLLGISRVESRPPPYKSLKSCPACP
ncbi:hypothetical protein B0T11DRAFT_271766 [Plectosphaerella cucumerina]|uniref:Uncharacterized protein n=1 Tax=Plectosphaerella cucumerina TaxID=40658 RepID=A0A8K0TPS8_9PEZI|nr:hypothetical protein B0T11DRAFT_271766 [Plectosphaerella cucumerina]